MWGARQGSSADFCQPWEEVLVAIGSRRKVCSGYEEEDRELSSQTHGCYDGCWVAVRVRVGWIQTGIGMRGDGKKEVMWLACEATRGRGEEATNA
jgi:hypothetical protein